jgi:general secretion pathway protein N
MTDRPPLSRAVLGATLVAAVLVVVATVVFNAPANWLAVYVARETRDAVLLADAQGTVWTGSAVVAVGAADGSQGGQPAERLALPGRVTWTLEWTRLLAPVLHLTHDGVLLQPLAVRYVGGAPTLDAGAAIVPASLLRLAGAPLNTLSPDGRCELRWNGLRIDPQGLPVGEGTLRIGGFALAISPVRPLGDYLVTWASGASGLVWQIATERGPLALEGNGRFGGARSQVRIVVRAASDTPAAVVARLGPLLDLIGRRGPNEAIIQSGAS